MQHKLVARLSEWGSLLVLGSPFTLTRFHLRGSNHIIFSEENIFSAISDLVMIS